jgi:hypothetical protein
MERPEWEYDLPEDTGEGSYDEDYDWDFEPERLDLDRFERED